MYALGWANVTEPTSRAPDVGRRGGGRPLDSLSLRAALPARSGNPHNVAEAWTEVVERFRICTRMIDVCKLMTVHVNGPWCITFEFDQGDAVRVDFEQYH